MFLSHISIVIPACIGGKLQYNKSQFYNNPIAIIADIDDVLPKMWSTKSEPKKLNTNH